MKMPFICLLLMCSVNAMAGSDKIYSFQLPAEAIFGSQAGETYIAFPKSLARDSNKNPIPVAKLSKVQIKAILAGTRSKTQLLTEAIGIHDFPLIKRVFSGKVALSKPIRYWNPQVNGKFGDREHQTLYRVISKKPFDYGTFENMHTGIDVQCGKPAGTTPIHPIGEGEVDVVNTTNGSYGHYVIVHHKDIGVYSLYAHLAAINVSVGDIVKDDSIIGTCGQTSIYEVPVHLHMEVGITESSRLVKDFIDPEHLIASAAETQWKLLTSGGGGGGGGRDPDPMPPTSIDPPLPSSPPVPPPDPGDDTYGNNDYDYTNWANKRMDILLGHDPNAMRGPSGYVTPGQLMTYEVEFENEGAGDAYGVYVTDTLDANLDETTLSVRDFKLVDWAANSETSTSLPYTFDALSRTITVQAGDFTSKKGGKFTIEARLKTGLAAGTVIPNFATVYFPNVLEKTPTNTIISVVPQQPAITYLGSTQARYADYAVFRSSLTMDGQDIVGKTVNYSVATATFSAITDAKTLGASELVTRLTVTPGTYTVTAAFPGDGYYYLSSTTTATLEVMKGYTVIPEFSTTSYSTSTITLPISLYDSNGAALLNQDTSPKTIYLEYQDSETWKSIGQMAISTDTANFEFAPPQPIQREYNIRARFPGDDYYDAIESTGTLILAATPVMTIDSPVAGAVYASSVPVRYAFTDIFDSSATVNSFFTRLADGTTVYALNNSTVPVFELAPGSWTFTMRVTELSGYMASSTTASFEVVADTVPPVTTLLAALPYYYGTNNVYVASGAYVALASTDAVSGVYGAYYAIDPSTSAALGPLSLQTTSQFTLYSATFTPVGEGYHYLSYGAIDSAGNAELLHSSTIYMDASLPLVTMSVAGVQASTDAVISMPAVSTISLTAVDPLIAGDASGIQAISYLVDKQPADCAGIALDSAAVSGTCANPLYAGAFTLLPGTHTLHVSAADRVDNRTVFTSTFVVDGLYPETALAFSSYTLYGAIPYVSSGAYIVLTSTDDLASAGDSAGLGVSNLRWRIGNGDWNVVSDSEPARGKVLSSTITLSGLSDGVYALQYFAEDKLGQIEPVRVSTFALSFTAPVVTISSPSAGAVFARSVRGTVPVSFSVSDAVDSNLRVAARLVEVQDDGLLNGATVMAVANGASVPASSLDDGLWRLEVFAQNIVGNSSTVLSSTFQVTNPPSVRWSGGAGTVYWLAASNWTGGVVPTEDMDVVIDSNVVVTATAPVSFNSLTLGGTNSPTFKLSAGTQDAGVLTVKNKATFEQSTISTVTFYSVMVESGGKLTHTANTTSKAYQLNIQTVSDFTLQPGATVYMDARGYSGGASGAANAGYGPGAGYGGGQGSGGGHGGRGGNSSTTGGGANYDNILSDLPPCSRHISAC